MAGVEAGAPQMGEVTIGHDPLGLQPSAPGSHPASMASDPQPPGHLLSGPPSRQRHQQQSQLDRDEQRRKEQQGLSLIGRQHEDQPVALEQVALQGRARELVVVAHHRRDRP